jgi:hypothetical protein
MKKQIQFLEKKVEAYDRLLTKIRPCLDSQDKELISRIRAQVRRALLRDSQGFPLLNLI